MRTSFHLHSKQHKTRNKVGAARIGAAPLSATGVGASAPACHHRYTEEQRGKPILPHLNCSLAPTVATAATARSNDSTIAPPSTAAESSLARDRESAAIPISSSSKNSTGKHKRVLRSLSVPTNLPAVAEQFMTVMMDDHHHEEEGHDDDDDKDDGGKDQRQESTRRRRPQQQQRQQQRQQYRTQQNRVASGEVINAARGSGDFVPVATASTASAAFAGGSLGSRSNALMSKLVVPVSSVTSMSNMGNQFVPRAGVVVGGAGFLPLARDDSLGSEQDFFLPFDEEDYNDTVDDSSSSPPPAPKSSLCPHALNPIQGTSMSTETETQKEQDITRQQQQQQQHSRHLAVASLEAFFFGQEPSLPPLLPPKVPSNTAADETVIQDAFDASSPVCTVDFDSHQQRRQNKSFHQQQQYYQNTAAPVSETMEPRGDSIGDNDECHDGSTNATTITTDSHFSRLRTIDRTTSLPVDMGRTTSSSLLHSNSSSFSPLHCLPRKSSLKRMSSYGHIPPAGTAVGEASASTTSTLTPLGSPYLKRNVSFGSMKIREYNVEISDHPSCSYGPPIQLSWDYKEREDETLDSYEEKRSTQKRRTGHELLLSFYERHFMLIKTAGYSKSEIRETMKEVERVKRERQITDMLLPTQKIDEQMENVVDTVKRLFGRK